MKVVMVGEVVRKTKRVWRMAKVQDKQRETERLEDEECEGALSLGWRWWEMR